MTRAPSGDVAEPGSAALPWPGGLLRYFDVTRTPALATDSAWRVSWMNEMAAGMLAEAGVKVGAGLTDSELRFEPPLTSRELEAAAGSSAGIARDIGVADGRVWRMMLVPAASVLGASSAVEGLLITFHAPVHESKSRDEIQRLLRTLAYRCDEIDAIVDLIPVGIVMMTGEDHGSSRLNARAAEILGIPARKVVREPETGAPAVCMFRGETRIGWEELPHRVAMATGEPVAQQRLRVAREDSDSEVLVSAVPLFDDAGTTRGSVAALVDVSELEEARRDSEVLARQASSVARLAVYALSQTDRDRLLRHFVRTVSRIVRADAAGFFEADDRRRTSELRLRAGTGWPRTARSTVLAAEKGSFARRVLAERNALLARDVAGGEAGSAPPALGEAGMRSALAARVSGENDCFGILAVFARTPERFGDAERTALEAAAATLAAALQRIRTETRLRDTEQRLALAATEERMHRAERLASLGTLAAGISHEINNPLNSILVNAELGNAELQRGKTPDEVKKRFGAIINDVKRCGAITHNVLQFASPQGDQPREPTPVGEVVSRTAELVGAYLRRSGVRLKTEIPDDLPPVPMNPTSIEQALVNLLQNAAQVGAGEVTVRAHAAGDEMVITVTDDGPGIGEPDVRRIFHPFYSTSRSGEGTGLGLSLVERIMHDHDGEVEAANVDGGGACFTLRLPLEQEAR